MSGIEVEIPCRVGPSPMPGYAALAPGSERGVVVVHEVLGRQPEIDRVVERFASAGYAAVEPDLFANAHLLTCIRRSLTAIAKGEGHIPTQIEDAKAWLRAKSGVPEHRIGVIGFCVGGGIALGVGRKFAAVSSNYGDLPPNEVLRDSPPIIACYGGRDRVFGRNAERLRERSDALNLRTEIHKFPTVGHSFLTDGDHPLVFSLSRPLFQVRWDPEVAEAAWTKILGFFDEHL